MKLLLTKALILITLFPFTTFAETSEVAQLHNMSLDSRVEEIAQGLGQGCKEGLSDEVGVLINCNEGSFLISGENVQKISFSCAVLDWCDAPKDLIFIRLRKGFSLTNQKLDHITHTSCGDHSTGEKICVSGVSPQTKIWIERGALPTSSENIGRNLENELPENIIRVSEIDRLCANMGKMAYNLMSLRQTNVAQSQVRGIVHQLGIPEGAGFSELALSIVSQAYDKPLWSTQANKAEAQKSFRNEVENTCYKTNGWSSDRISVTAD
ncbi:hypothetical protein NBRC116598_26200 [Pseudophaeobacter arcticus]|uniref:YARHG domain-containing protein n=1 Tax=Pseudophaeobacter arcticus TaxID=385492 RepID=A0ABQ0AMS1_9RHOB